MSDEKMKMIAELEFRASGSATIAALQAKIKALKDQLNKSFAPTAITKSIISPAVRKELQGTGKAINGLTKKYTDMAKEARELGQMNARVWKGIQRDITNTQKAWRRASGDERSRLGSDLKEKVKYAQAYRSLYNRENQRYLSNLQSLHRAENALHLAQWRQREQHERAQRASALRSRAAFARATSNIASSVRQGGFQAALYGGAAIYGTGRAVSTAVRSATDFDRAETNARINMDEKDIPGGFAGLRERAFPKAVSLGQDPARYMQTVVEAAKAGVPENLAEGTGEMVTMLAKTFGVEVDQAMDGMGYAIAQEFGAGRLKDMAGVRRLGNISAFLAAKTAARPDQMFSFLRTGMGSGAMLGMSQEATLAFGASGIQAGAQGQQAARFLGSLGTSLAELTMEYDKIVKKHHKTKEDREFLSLPGKLGYGSYADIEQKIRKSPDTAIFDLIKSFGKIKAPLDRKRAMSQMFGEDFSRFLANMIASPEMLDRTMKLAKEAAQQKEGADFISDAWGEFTKSLEFFMGRIGATWKVIKTELGDVLKPFIEQLSQYVTDWYNTVKTGGLKDKFKAILDGLTEGFLGNKGTFRDLLEKMFGKPGEKGLGKTENWFKFARGFATGLREFATGFGEVMSTLAKYFGENGDDAEAMGRFTAKLLGLVAALTALSPVISVFSTLVTIATALVSIFGGPVALSAVAAYLAERNTPDHAKKRPGETVNQWRERQRQHKKELYQKQSGEGFDPKNVHKMSYLTDSFDKLGGKIERASLMSTDFSSRGRTYGGGGGLSGGTSGSAGLISGVGTPDALIKNVTPGGALPNFGMGAGGIIRRGGKVDMGYSTGKAVTSGSEAAVGAMSGPADGVGAGMGGSGFLAARRARFAEEIKNDPSLRLHLAAMQMTEGISGGGTIESLMNRTDMQGSSLRKMLGYNADGTQSVDSRGRRNSFYGPIRRGELPAAIAKLQSNPKLFQKYDAYTQRALAGSHAIGGYTDQGLPTDPNGSRRTGIPGFKISPKDGNEFTDWVGPGSSWGRGRGGAMNYRRYIEQHINDVPSPTDAIKNVPAAPQSGVPMRGGFGGGSGSVAIHINGNSHDPEALATLVQRRVDESMNWRAHDSESEYT